MIRSYSADYNRDSRDSAVPVLYLIRRIYDYERSGKEKGKDWGICSYR